MRRSPLTAIPLGGSSDFELNRARELGSAWAEANLSRIGQSQPTPVEVSRSDYAAAYNSTTLAPANPLDGAELPYGRVWAEARSITHSGGSGSVGVILISSQNGCRAVVVAPQGQTITGGSVRFWSFDPVDQLWILGGVEETLATGTRAVSTTDQFITVGAH